MTWCEVNKFKYARKIKRKKCFVKFVFSKKATKIKEIFSVDLTLTTYVKSTVMIFSNFVAFLQNINFN